MNEHDDDRGAVLVLALIVVTVFSVIAVAIASYAITSFQRTQVTKARIDKVHTANSGIRYAVEKLRLDPTLCSGPAAQTLTGQTITFPGALAGGTPTITCRWVGGAAGGINSWAVVATGEGLTASQASLVTSNAANDDHILSGPVYVAGPRHLDLAAVLKVEDGFLLYQSSTCGPPANSGSKSFTVSPFPYAAACTSQTWRDVLILPTPPPVPTTPAPAPVPGTCQVLQPGKYTAAPDLTIPTYLRSGVYYFEKVGQITVDDIVVGGKPGPGDTAVLSTTPTCDAQRAADPNPGTGVVLVLGGNSRVYADKDARLELFTATGHGGTDAINVTTLEPGTPNYLTTTVTPASGQKLYANQNGSGYETVIHGAVYAPYSVVHVRVTNGNFGQVRNGVVGAQVEAEKTSSGTGFLIKGQGGPFDQQLVITSSAPGTRGAPITATAVVQIPNDARTVAVNSWRVG
jgi:Tfp pilus assembly protein PilX